MKVYQFRIILDGTIEVEAENEQIAKEMVDEGVYNINDMSIDDVEEEYLGEITHSILGG